MKTTITVSIQGGNSYALNCLTDQTIIQNLTTAKEISTTTQGSCQDKFSIFVDSYADFVKTYNTSIHEEFKNCIDAKASNTRNYEVIQTLNTSLTSCIETQANNETIFYNEWKTCIDKPEKETEKHHS